MADRTIRAIKWKYTLNFLGGLFFLFIVFVFIYWLLFEYQIRNFFGLMAILLFLISPAFIAIKKIPNEIRALIIIWNSDDPEKVDKILGDFREEGML